ncbi:MAG: hypothetical protein CVV21_01915 [Candidatus Goldiibacteriota bacterium HGW-Goldbacteria-1]|nr:MAG: hypothetical protein CVV21_01915 [Candidatus Goldiibacteriota bacterium HGW-Goldbacteria-1]
MRKIIFFLIVTVFFAIQLFFTAKNNMHVVTALVLTVMLIPGLLLIVFPEKTIELHIKLHEYLKNKPGVMKVHSEEFWKSMEYGPNKSYNVKLVRILGVLILGFSIFSQYKFFF